MTRAANPDHPQLKDVDIEAMISEYKKENDKPETKTGEQNG